MQGIPESIRSDLITAVYGDFLRAVPLLSGAKQELIDRVAARLEVCSNVAFFPQRECDTALQVLVLPKHTVIARRGSTLAQLILVLSGTLVLKGREMRHIGQGDSAGGESLLGEAWDEDLVAESNCLMLSLKSVGWEEALRGCSDMPPGAEASNNLNSQFI